MAKKRRLEEILAQREKAKQNTSNSRNVRQISTGLPTTRQQMVMPRRTTTEVQALAQSLFNRSNNMTAEQQKVASVAQNYQPIRNNGLAQNNNKNNVQKAISNYNPNFRQTGAISKEEINKDKFLDRVKNEKDPKSQQKKLQQYNSLFHEDKNINLIRKEVKDAETVDKINNGTTAEKVFNTAKFMLQGTVEGAVGTLGQINATAQNISRNTNYNKVKKAQEYANSYQQSLQNVENGLVKFGGQVTNTVGAMLPSIGMNLIAPGTGNIMAGVSAGSSAYLETLNEGQDNKGKAMLTGVLKGTLAGTIEKIIGGNKIGTGALDDIAVKNIAKVKSQLAQKLLSKGYEVVGEVGEENLENFAGYLVDMAINNKKVTVEDIVRDLIDTTGTTAGATLLLSALGLGGGTFNDVQTESNKNNQIKNSGLTKNQQQKLTEVAQKYDLSQADIQNLIDNTKNGKYGQKQATTMENKPISNQSQQVIQQEGKIDEKAISQQIEQNIEKGKYNRAESVKNFLESAKKYNKDTNSDTLKEMVRVADERQVDLRYDASVFKGNKNQNAIWKIKKDENGKVISREVILNPDSTSDANMEQIWTHEITHDMEGSGKYAKMRKQLLDYLQKKPEYQSAFNDLKAIYSEVYAEENLTEQEFNELIEDEVVADMLGSKLGDTDFLSKLNKENRTVAQKIYDWVVDRLNKINKLTGYKNEKLFWQDIKNKFENAFKEDFVDSGSKNKFSTDTNKKSLLAVHNLSADKLKGVLELGGFPVPSIAVTNPNKVNHESYGAISVIFNKNTIDPTDERNEVYDRDVWSPTFPTVEYEINEDVISEIRKMVGGYKNSYQNGANSTLNNLEDRINRIGVEKTLEELKKDSDFKYVYAKTLKDTLEPIYKDVEENIHRDFSNETIKEFINEYGKVPKWAEITSKDRNTLIEKFKNKVIPELEKRVEEKRKKLYEENPNPPIFKLRILESSVENAINKLDALGYQDNLIEVMNKIQDGNTTVRHFDKVATDALIDEIIKDGNYENWIDSTFKDIILSKGIYNDKDYLKPDGTRRTFKQLHDNYNLSNIVKYMTSKATKSGQVGFGSGSSFGSISAQKANRFNSIEEIKNAESRLTSEEKELIKPYEELIYADMDELAKYIKHKSDYVLDGEIVGPALNELASKEKLTDSVVKKVFDNNNIDYKKVPKTLIDKIISDLESLRNVPTDYFEAKPQRAVGFEEIASMVIPNNLDSDLKKQLQARGIKTIEYDPNIEGDRNAKMTSAELEEYKFSLSQETKANLEAKIDRYSKLVEEMQQDGKDAEEWAPYANEILRLQDQLDGNRFSRESTGAWNEFKNKYGKNEGRGKTNAELTLDQPKKVSEVLKPKKKVSEVLPKQTTQAEKRQLVDEVYREDIAEGKVRKHYKSVFDSDQVGDVGKDVAKELLKKDTYVPISNLETITLVNDNISRNGIGATYNAFRTKVRSNEKITLQDVATGERLIQIYSQKGDYAKVNELIQDVAILGTELGQQVQALSLIKRASPEGQLQYLTKLLERTNIKENTNIKITDEMTEKILGAKNQEDLEKKLTEVAVELAEQLPVSKSDMIRSWRYLSMLGNPKTHIKNFSANVAMNLTQRAKNAVAGAIEGVASVFNPEMERTKTIKFANREQKQFAKQDAELMKDLIDAGGKYDVKNVIQESKKQFNNKVLNAIADFNSKLLDKEDKIFLKSAYKMAMQNYMSANNLKASDMEGKTLEKARQYASLQAQEATFHEFNVVAQHLSQIENKGGLIGGAMSAVLPFKKTPMNIAKAGIQYSPVGLASSVTYDVAQIAKQTKKLKQQLSEGKITEEQYKSETSRMVNKTIDNMAKGLTGTSLAVLGYALAKMGVLKAGNDGEDDEFKQKLGEQEYAITIGDNTYTLDWVSPSAIPMFTGASIYQLMTGDVEDQKSVLNSTLTAFSKTFEPMTDMSMLQGLTSAITSYEQGSSNMIFDLGASMVTSYAGQFVPTVAGQVARIADPYERDTSSTKKGIEGKVDKFAKQTMNKIPGLSQKLPKKTDVWGEDVKRPENLVQRTLETAVLPWTRKSLVEDRTAQELLKVFDESGENVLPGNPNKDLTINKIKYRMSTEEYNEAKRNFGQTSKALLDDLFKSKTYNTLTAEGKAKAIDDVYAYAKEKIKVEYAEDNNHAVKPTNLYNTVTSLEENNADVSAYFEFKGKIDDLDREKGEESVKNKEKMSYLKEMKTDAKTKRIIYEDTLGTNDEVYQNLSKLTGNKVNIDQYLDYKTAEIKGIDDPKSIVKGKTKSGSKKANLQKYLRESNFSEVEALYIYGTQNSLNSTQRVQITNYINKAKQAGRLTASEEKELYKKLNSVEELEDGRIRWK